MNKIKIKSSQKKNKNEIDLPESNNWVKSCCCCCCWDVRLGKRVEKNGFIGKFDDVQDVFIEPIPSDLRDLFEIVGSVICLLF